MKNISLRCVTVGKGKIALNEQFLFFPQCFLPIWRTFCHFHQIQNCRLQTLFVCKSLKFVVWERVKTTIAVERKHSGCLTHYHALEEKTFSKHCGKRRKC